MNTLDRPMGRLEHRIRKAENDLFAVLDDAVEERFLDLERTDLRVRVLSHGSGVPLLLMHGVRSWPRRGLRCSPSFKASDCSRSTSQGTGCRIPSATGAVAFANTRTG